MCTKSTTSAELCVTCQGASKAWLMFHWFHSFSFNSWLSLPLLCFGNGRGRARGSFENGGTGKLCTLQFCPLQWQSMEHSSGQDWAEQSKLQQALHWLLLTAWELRQKQREQVCLCFCFVSSQKCFCLPLLCTPTWLLWTRGPYSHRTQHHWLDQTGE